MWEGTTKKVGGHNFTWTNGVAGDISNSTMIRFAVYGTNDSYICFAEEKQEESKKITYVLGGWGNKISTVAWRAKGQNSNRGWHGVPQDAYTYNGQVHNGPETPAWIEVEWDIDGGAEGKFMQISKIKDQNGGGK